MLKGQDSLDRADAQPPDLRVEKRELGVRMLLDGREWHEGTIFLYLSSRLRPGRERISDFLKEEEGFLAFRENEGTRLVNVDRITALVAPVSEEIDELYDLSYKVDAEVEVTGGHLIDGQLFGLLPQEGTRTKDLMNQEEQFVRLSCNDEVYLINKAAIISVRETGGGGALSAG